ncbi:hypothetical protein COMNV_01630 [Commensalibacter sp. Nvir]|uniref:hypothetical protein n=1 Tax=Commensalibacter sp. Nvir TaxID=3069817 RepID=UPI002D284C3C|nr:hypothetical protein COMNV_01630 [Commensalibacter sp. Nvir]
MIKRQNKKTKITKRRPWIEVQFSRFVKVLNRCEGQSLQTVAPHNGPILKGVSNGYSRKKSACCKDTL